MKWVIAPRVRCDIHAYAGLGMSGQRALARIFAAGGRQGEEIDGSSLQSAIIVGPPGTRVVFSTTVADEGWEERPWRAIVLTEKDAFATRDGKLGVRIPDLDWLDEPKAHRADPDFQASFDHAESLDEGTGWTYGRGGSIKNQVRCIRVDRVDG